MDNKNHENLELRIAKVLRLGVLVSGFFLLAGWIGLAFGGVPESEDAHVYRQVPFSSELHAAIAHGDKARLLCYAGLFILISLPLLRVGLTAILFWKQRDRVLAAVATFVFVAIIFSCALGLDVV